ncbi:MAG: putative esterase/lipase [Candidatus Carbobacillus altaicus]|uniref:Putative esterase/lipase n=1 Tax=Candidatus Carbonibacillus altaicus TaxID=2163959 RepID=A0A2R6XY41_9BACL|nr:MAG: putative esterase/lipase [Candidatus Carbobacillus altaicus]
MGKETIERRRAEPIRLAGGSAALLLIHGFTGTTEEFRPMADYFHAKGLSIYAPLLPGHGTSPEEMAKTRWTDWWQAVVDAYQTLQREGHTPIYVSGLSMGGALSLYLAAKVRPAAVFSLAAPIRFRDKRAYVARYFYRLRPYLPRDGQKPEHIERYLIPYDRTPVRSVAELVALLRRVRRSLPAVTVPTFIAQGRQDETIIPEDATLIYHSIGTFAEQKVLKWYDASSHLIILDHDQAQLFEDMWAFMQNL